MICQGSPFRWLGGCLAVDQPRYAKLIDDHTKTIGPKRFVERHDDPTVHGQVTKDTLGVSRARDLERERETFWFLIAVRRDVTTHQCLAANSYAAVHDLVLPVGRNLIGQGRPGVTEDRPELAAKTPLIE